MFGVLVVISGYVYPIAFNGPVTSSGMIHNENCEFTDSAIPAPPITMNSLRLTEVCSTYPL